MKYLEYFRESKYLTYIRYPHCLKILELLNKNEDFIRFEHFSLEKKLFLFFRLLDNPNFIFQLFEQQFFHWFTNQPKLKIQEKEQIKEIV